MSETIINLMRANLLEVFNERDEARRLAAIARTYTEDVVFYDPEEVVTGHNALNEKARDLLEKATGFVFSPAGPAYANHNLGYLDWIFGPEGQPPVVSGIDIALIKDGRIATLYTILKK
ncbi:MAG: hypothetical protein BGO39_06030 [Chloroflexi bacterium 54-19]|nr:MAG: hypothetical protein BGO39_06030 [Chloroflexi bacterium 54-19]